MNTVTSKDGTKIAYDIYGSGPALIYITGASCFRNFIPVKSDAKAFGKEFTVYNYDRRGRGDSGNTLPYSMHQEIEDIEALIDAAGGSAYLYGHSSGAVLALNAALQFGNKVKKVAIYDASYVHDATEKAEYAELGKTIKQLIIKGEYTKAMSTFLVEIGMPKPFVRMLPLFPGWRTMKALAPTLEYDIALTQDVPPLKKVSNITVPTFVIVGGKSPVSLHDTAHQLAKAIPNANYAMLDNQDHMVKTSVLLPLLVKFLK